MDNSKLALLDMIVTTSQEETPTFEFFKKATKKDIFVHRQSALPLAMKKNNITNERERISQRFSSSELSEKHKKIFYSVLSKNGYSRGLMDQTKRNRPRVNSKSPPDRYFYMNISFKSDDVNWR
jgi:hypothetical protein